MTRGAAPLHAIEAEIRDRDPDGKREERRARSHLEPERDRLHGVLPARDRRGRRRHRVRAPQGSEGGGGLPAWVQACWSPSLQAFSRNTFAAFGSAGHSGRSSAYPRDSAGLLRILRHALAAIVHPPEVDARRLARATGERVSLRRLDRVLGQEPPVLVIGAHDFAAARVPQLTTSNEQLRRALLVLRDALAAQIHRPRRGAPRAGPAIAIAAAPARAGPPGR